MFDNVDAATLAPRRGAWRQFLAADAAASYDTGGAQAAAVPAGPVTIAELRARGVAVPGLAEAVELAELAADHLVAADLDTEPDAAITTAAVELAAVGHRLDGGHLRVLERLDARGCHLADGAATAASWYRTRTRTDAAEAATLLRAAVRLRDLPKLRAALEAGAVSLRHVQTITRAAIPARRAAFTDAEDTLVSLARRADPRRLAVAVRHLARLLDPDPEPDLPEGRRDPRRSLHLAATIDGLWDLAGTLDPVTGEALFALLDALSPTDPDDAPPEERRTFAQRRHDALADLVDRATGLPGLPTVHGRPPHVAVFVDLLALAHLLGVLPEGILPAGADQRPAARLRTGGPLSPHLALRLLATATVTIVTAAGPWRPVNVGRRMRTLPPYLRDVLHLLHTRCRGPDCDRYVTWTEAHHLHPWDAGGDTDFNQTIPVCKRHHQLAGQGWTATLDTATGTVTWTTSTGRTITNDP